MNHASIAMPPHRRRASDRLGIGEIRKGGGETGELLRAFDWASSPLGPVESWSTSLRAVAGVVLRNPYPLARKGSPTDGERREHRRGGVARYLTEGLGAFTG